MEEIYNYFSKQHCMVKCDGYTGYDNEKSLVFAPKKKTQLELFETMIFDRHVEIMDEFDKYNDEKIKYYSEAIRNLNVL